MPLSLYELTADYERLIDLASHAGTPEEEAMYQEAMRSLSGTIEEKCDRCAAVMATLQAEADALGNEEERLYARRAAILANRDRLRSYVQECMESVDISKVKGPRFTLIIQANTPKVVVDEESKLGLEYWKNVPSLDKAKIATDLKAGRDVPGAHLETGRSLRIR